MRLGAVSGQAFDSGGPSLARASGALLAARVLGATGFFVAAVITARSLGASPLRAFRRVVLPGIAPGVAAGAVFAFLASFDEATVAFFISGIEGKTVTRKMFEDIDFNLTPVIAAVSTLLVTVSIGLMACVHLLHGRQRGGQA